jgi:hypothetical protein
MRHARITEARSCSMKGKKERSAFQRVSVKLNIWDVSAFVTKERRTLV